MGDRPPVPSARPTLGLCVSLNALCMLASPSTHHLGSLQKHTLRMLSILPRTLTTQTRLAISSLPRSFIAASSAPASLSFARPHQSAPSHRHHCHHFGSLAADMSSSRSKVAIVGGSWYLLFAC